MSVFRNKECIIEGKKYKICELIETGGNGSVWSIRDLGDGQIYAIKFLDVLKEDKIERFKKEVLFCRNNPHKNIVKVLAEGKFKDKECYIMPKYEKTLRDIMKEEKNLLDLFNYIKQLCEAIKYAHDNGVIHRDIKPENIFIDKGKKLVLADFGIAHFIDATMTEKKEWLGNKSYAAPEQLIKEAQYEVTTASDIYALGKIINELFTGENAAGTEFVTITDKYPILPGMDRLVHRCMLQNPVERPDIAEITVEIQLIEGQLKESIEEIEEYLLLDKNPDYSEKDIKRMLPTICEDILMAMYYFRDASEELLEKLNINYHKNVRYKIDTALRNLCFQKEVMNRCKRKFIYESRGQVQGDNYVPLNMDNSDDYKLYEEFKEQLFGYILDSSFMHIIGMNLKLFSSCCYYHCVELLEEIKDLISNYETFDDLPIIYLVCRLRNILSHEEIEEIDLLEHISIDYKNTCIAVNEENQIFQKKESEEEKVLVELKKKWKVIINKNDEKYYFVIFETKEQYEEFKKYVSYLAKGHFVFEGDVQAVLSVNREYEGIVEIGPLDSFDINSTLAKILGLRKF